jgi:hypothetical protein
MIYVIGLMISSRILAIGRVHALMLRVSVFQHSIGESA